MFRDYSSVLLLSCSITTSALGNPSLFSHMLYNNNNNNYSIAHSHHTHNDMSLYVYNAYRYCVAAGHCYDILVGIVEDMMDSQLNQGLDEGVTVEA